MSYSNHETREMMKCESCFYADQEKLEEIKKHHDNEDWEKCGMVLGSCTFPYQRNLEFPEKGKIICHEHTEK